MKIVLLLSFLLIVPAHSQDNTHTLRFLSVGQPPAFKIIERDGKRYEADPPKGSIPPAQLQFISGDSAQEVTLKLNHLSQRLGIKLPETRLARLAAPATAESEPSTPSWWQGKLSTGNSSLIILFRNPKDKDWNKPRSIILPDHKNAFPSGSVRLINTTPFPIIPLINRKKQATLKPGAHRILKGSKLSLTLSVSNKKGKPVRLYTNTITLATGQRANMVIHNAKPRTPSKPPAQILLLKEQAK